MKKRRNIFHLGMGIAALYIFAATWIAIQSGCAAPGGPTLPASIPVELERAPAK